ncbi:MAG TPA: hypothetical protein VKP30_23895 [Polyangiaceae bacterium]|nr:hypothetical protein [Polyangiaceae bacterium]
MTSGREARRTVAMLTKAKRFISQSDECKVNREDLKRLGQVKELLTLLNDPYIGSYKLTACLDALPVLTARCRREAALHRPRAEAERIDRALSVLGNRGLEKVLLEFLEDMTILRSELESEGAVIPSAPPASAPKSR